MVLSRGKDGCRTAAPRPTSRAARRRCSPCGGRCRGKGRAGSPAVDIFTRAGESERRRGVRQGRAGVVGTQPKKRQERQEERDRDERQNRPALVRISWSIALAHSPASSVSAVRELTPTKLVAAHLSNGCRTKWSRPKRMPKRAAGATARHPAPPGALNIRSEPPATANPSAVSRRASRFGSRISLAWI